MARTTGTESLRDLLARNAVRPGEPIEIRRRSAPAVRGVIQPDGSIRVGTAVDATPSTAARRALGGGAVDGWVRWRVPRLDDRTLAEIREER